MSIVRELRRRNVFRMAVLYTMAAWLIMQVAGVVIGFAQLSDRIGPAILWLLATGFPIAIPETRKIKYQNLNEAAFVLVPPWIKRENIDMVYSEASLSYQLRYMIIDTRRIDVNGQTWNTPSGRIEKVDTRKVMQEFTQTGPCMVDLV
jgi:hypothetical protein